MNHHSAFRSRSTTLRTMKMKHLLNLLFLVLLLLLFLWLFHYLAKTLECVNITTAKQIHNLTVAVAVNVREKKIFVMLRYASLCLLHNIGITNSFAFWNKSLSESRLNFVSSSLCSFLSSLSLSLSFSFFFL